jgi:hypothetical protein
MENFTVIAHEQEALLRVGQLRTNFGYFSKNFGAIDN